MKKLIFRDRNEEIKGVSEKEEDEIV